MRIARVIVLCAIGPASSGFPQTAPAQQSLDPSEAAAAFEAGGFQRVEGLWQSCGDPGTAAYEAGQIAEVRDLDGDGHPEAILTEGSSYCFGATGVGYSLVSRQPDGQWRLITQGAGVLTALATTGQDAWPDLEIGGPGFCFPVHRWNGREYALDRYQYDGTACRPGE